MSSPFALYKIIGLAGIIIICDRVFKLLALQYCLSGPCIINRFMSFEVVINRGISWGLLTGQDNTLFIAVTLLVMFITTFLLWFAYRCIQTGQMNLGYVCIIAGSIGNIIDRLYYKGVIDFIELSYNDWVWPVFNGADIAIVAGVGLLLFDYYRKL